MIAASAGRTMVLVGMIALLGAWGSKTWQSAVAEDLELDGPIVEISPAKADEEAPERTPETQVAGEPTYWIGLRGRNVDDPALRTQLQLAEDMGVVIEQVVPNSPAEKAGLRKHDIVLRAGGTAVDGMSKLQEIVGAGAPIELKLLRLGKEISVTVTPEERPEELGQLAQEADPRTPRGQDGFRQLLEQFQGGRGLPRGMPMLGPEAFNGGRLDLNQMPDGISISIARENDGEPRITVKRGDEVWTIEGDSEESLDQLPDDLRPFVERVLRGQSGGMQFQFGDLDWEAEFNHWLPDRLRGLDRPGIPRDRILERMEEMEQRLQELQQRFQNRPVDE